MRALKLAHNMHNMDQWIDVQTMFSHPHLHCLMLTLRKHHALLTGS